MPEEGKHILQFNKIEYQQPIPYVIYADFESLVVPYEEAEDGKKTEKISRHVPCGYSYVVIGPDGKCVKKPVVHRGPDATSHLVMNLLKEKSELAPKITTIIPMKLTPAQEMEFQNATICHICKQPLGAQRVRDHCHQTGRFRGASHNKCNLQFKTRKIIPVIFHNLKNYDAHHLMRCFGEFPDCKYEVIANTMEKYITFSVCEEDVEKSEKVALQFLDSFQFLPTSLEKLVENLKEGDFKIMKQNYSTDKVKLLLRKGIYPYEYMDSFNKFEEEHLPPPEAFFSKLSNKGVTPEDYNHALNVWSSFNIQDLGQYHNLYVTSDTLLLADVFQNFRKICLKFYEIDPAHLFTAPSLAWQSCLKKTQQPLELFTDLDMHLFIEKAIRGGISVISKRQAVANYPASSNYPASPNYDCTKPNNHLMYLDANNLYGWAMSQSLPYGDFKWEDPEEFTAESILKLKENGSRGYIFEVDLDYPVELHDLHNDYPLAAEKLKVTEDMISPTSQQILKKLNMKFQECEKLVPNLMDKKNYITYYKNLQLYLSLGLQLKKIHKVLSFKQKKWLAPYISFNTEKRKEASSTFEKDFFKLLNNSVYGKTMEDIRKHLDIQLVNNSKKALKLIASPTFQNFKMFSDNLAAIQRLKANITLNRPIYLGFVILELSKYLMYDFHYNHIKKTYDDKATLLFTDTDSLMYEVQTENIYNDMKSNLELYDTSDYPKSHQLYSEKNKKVIGKFKDEMNGKPIHEFIGLRSKMYSILSEDCEKKTAKGVSRNVVAQKIRHEDYRDCLKQIRSTVEEMVTIRSFNHEIFTIRQRKTALSPYDDKRYLLDVEDGRTLAYGHYRIRKK